MKRLLTLTLILLMSVPATISARQQGSKFRPEGRWKFEAPAAPEGYTFGTMEVTSGDNKYSAFMGLPGAGDYKLPAEQVKFESDSLTFKLYIQGEEISIVLKPEGVDKMTGKAVYSGGEIPLTCNREKETR
jgi:hypothetical protein